MTVLQEAAAQTAAQRGGHLKERDRALSNLQGCKLACVSQLELLAAGSQAAADQASGQAGQLNAGQACWKVSVNPCSLCSAWHAADVFSC